MKPRVHGQCSYTGQNCSKMLYKANKTSFWDVLEVKKHHKIKRNSKNASFRTWVWCSNYDCRHFCIYLFIFHLKGLRNIHKSI